MPIIELKNVSKSYRMGSHSIPAIVDISLTVKEGELIAITGPSGSGKSTLLHLIGCLDTPDTGHVKICGFEISSSSRAELANLRRLYIGFVFQSFNLLPKFNVLDNIALPLAYSGVRIRERIERAREIARLVGLEERLNHFPSQLRGGQAQRVAIARALIHNPALLL
ncbi:MAG: ABC transporter ATP-binding protein, partial [Chthoniobacterales bacterium]|nr:ABC transporter ATP-binding protein [Chthoniobacterales bacterium]